MNTESFTQLYQETRQRLLIYARRLGIGDAAEDIVEETFLRAWKAILHGAVVEGTGYTWLQLILKRIVIY